MKRTAGFSMVELIVVMVLIGIVSAIAVPKMMSSNVFAPLALRDEIQSTLRYAQKTAVARRRLICATRMTSATASVFTIASTAGANTCAVALTSPVDIAILGSVTLNSFNTTLSWPLYFQPDGTITSDPAGLQPQAGSISFTYEGDNYAIQVDGVSGYVE